MAAALMEGMTQRAATEPSDQHSDRIVEFLSAAARALHANGAPVDQIETSLTACAEALGQRAEINATPTCIYFSVGAGSAPAHLIRAGAGATNLGRLVAIDRVLTDVREGRLGAQAGHARLESAAAGEVTWGPRALVVGFGLTSAGAAVFFGGGLGELVLSFMVGALLGLLSVLASARPSLAQLYDTASAFTASFASLMLAAWLPGIDAQIVAIAGLVVLLPGLSLTLSLSEIATNHLVSGTSRLAGSLSVFACMAVGVALARSLFTGIDIGATLELGALANSALWTAELPAEVRWLALVISPIGWAICWQARVIDLPAIALTGVLANEVCRICAASASPEIAAFASALVVGLAANIYATRRALPRAVVLQPCLLLLVPGSMGFRGMTSLMNHQLDVGVDTLTSVVVLASTLVAGVLVANWIPVPVPRARLETKAARATALTSAC